jgi:hypothetical protein
MNATAVIVGGRAKQLSAGTKTASDAPRSGPQHLQALERANQVRLARADIKRRIASGDLSAAEIVRTPPEEVLTMEVAELLTSQRRWGHTRARRFLAGIPLTETKTLGSMTLRQRETLASMLAALGPRGSRSSEQQVAEAA